MTRYLLAVQQPDDPDDPTDPDPQRPGPERLAAVALAEVEGPARALDVVDGLDLPRHHLRDAVRADLLTRLDRPDEARAALRAARAKTDNPGERALLARRLGELR